MTTVSVACRQVTRAIGRARRSGRGGAPAGARGHEVERIPDRKRPGEMGECNVVSSRHGEHQRAVRLFTDRVVAGCRVRFPGRGNRVGISESAIECFRRNEVKNERDVWRHRCHAERCRNAGNDAGYGLTAKVPGLLDHVSTGGWTLRARRRCWAAGSARVRERARRRKDRHEPDRGGGCKLQGADGHPPVLTHARSVADY